MKNFYFKLFFLVILFIIPTTSHSYLMHYSVSEAYSPYGSHMIMSTPDGSYSVNIFGSVWIESEPVPAQTRNIFNINSFAINIDIPELGESLTFAGSGNSTLEMSSYDDPWGNLWLDRQLNLNGTGNFEYWWFGEFSYCEYDEFNGDLPKTISINDDFSGGGALEPFTAPVIGKDNWVLLNSETGILLEYAPVPEPGTVWLFAFGIIGLVGIKRNFLWTTKFS